MLSAVIPTERSQPAVPLARQPAYQRFVHPGPLVLWAGLPRIPTSAEDRDQTVSRRSEPSSRAALIGEQPNPWDLLQPQDATSRHRGAKPSRRYGLLGMISLLSPGYLLSVERCRARAPAPDHYHRLSSLLGPPSSQSGPLVRLHSTPGCQPGRGDRCAPPLLFGRQPPQLNYPPGTVPDTDDVPRLDARCGQSGISPSGSPRAGARGSQPPAYATQSRPDDNTKV